MESDLYSIYHFHKAVKETRRQTELRPKLLFQEAKYFKQQTMLLSYLE